MSRKADEEMKECSFKPQVSVAPSFFSKSINASKD